jgi:hypothetical protein
MQASDIPLVRGGKLPQEALCWLEEVERVFPGATKDIVIVRKPNPTLPRGEGIGIKQRDRKSANGHLS